MLSMVNELKSWNSFCIFSALIFILTPIRLQAESSQPAWLGYTRLTPEAAKPYANLPQSVIVLGESAVLKSGGQELVRGVERMLGRSLTTVSALPSQSTIILGTAESVRSAMPKLQVPASRDDGYWLAAKKDGDV